MSVLRSAFHRPSPWLAHPFERGYSPLEEYARRVHLTHDDLVYIERSANRDLHVVFQGTARYDSLCVDFDSGTGVLMVAGENVGASHSAGARRLISMPCVVTKPLALKAQVHDGQVVVTVPHDAQAPLPDPTTVRPPETKSLVMKIHDSTKAAPASAQQGDCGHEAADLAGMPLTTTSHPPPCGGRGASTFAAALACAPPAADAVADSSMD
ncbi:hypothetical protein KFE25_006759 [Diacronema lutheri]|uniref:SHSP domain-containing protein n=1 Tax=Diacronema lutheri TaxID=2081491 RepID=A0A8J6CAJ3_DIALT|nr:hypothetical protein KFE25_006759 [Diacronema lutheri]